MIIILLALPFLSLGQSNTRSSRDSVQFYEKEYKKQFKEALDSINKSEKINSLKENINRLKTISNSYSGNVLFGGILHSDFTEFNKSIQQDGFGKMSPYSFRFGMGVSTKTEHIIFDFYLVTLGGNHTSKKGNEKVQSSLSNMFQFDLGYDFLNSKTISFYPYAGLSARIASLSYINPGQLNPNFSNITNITQNSETIFASSFRIGYQAGLGLDIVAANFKQKGTAIILFTKAGTNRPIGTDRFKILGEQYKPGIKNGDWLVNFGIKFARRVKTD